MLPHSLTKNQLQKTVRSEQLIIRDCVW